MNISTVVTIPREPMFEIQTLDAAPDKLCQPETQARRQQMVLEGDEIVLKAGDAEIVLRSANGGIVEIRARHVQIIAEQIQSAAADTNSMTGRKIVSEATDKSELYGKLVRIDGQCVKIS